MDIWELRETPFIFPPRLRIMKALREPLKWRFRSPVFNRPISITSMRMGLQRSSNDKLRDNCHKKGVRRCMPTILNISSTKIDDRTFARRFRRHRACGDRASIRDHKIHPTINYEDVDPECESITIRPIQRLKKTYAMQ